MKKLVVRLAVFAVLFAAALLPAQSWAASIVWNGGSGDWETPGNWSPVGVPGAGDDVVIDATGAIVDINSAVSVKSLKVESGTLVVFAGCSLTVSEKLETEASGTNTAMLIVDGKLDIPAGGTVEIGRIVGVYSTISVSNGGELSNYGEINNDGQMDTNPGGTIFNFGLIKNTYNMTNGGTIYNYGTLDNSSTTPNALINQGDIWSNGAIANVSVNVVKLFSEDALKSIGINQEPMYVNPAKYLDNLPPQGIFGPFQELEKRYPNLIGEFYAIYEPGPQVPAAPVTIGAGLTFKINLISGATTVPEAVEELLKNFTITKVFPTGDVLDLIKTLDQNLGAGVITYSINLLTQTATLTIVPQIIIIDGPVPANAVGAIRPVPGSDCGMVYFKAGAFGTTIFDALLIYDGVEDGVIADPIAVMDKALANQLEAQQNSRGSSGGGCNAANVGMGVFGLLAVALLKFRIKNA